MIEAYHVIFGAYGFWLPNDPRGSWSDFVGSYELLRFGPATKTTERHSVAHRPHDRRLRLAAKEALKYPAVQFNAEQVQAIADGFAYYFERSQRSVLACAIMPVHVHLVVGRGHISAEQLAIQLKGDATVKLKERGLHPFGDLKNAKGKTPKCFARGEWKVFLDLDDIPRAIRYVELNPERDGLPRQNWAFVVPYIV